MVDPKDPFEKPETEKHREIRMREKRQIAGLSVAGKTPRGDSGLSIEEIKAEMLEDVDFEVDNLLAKFSEDKDLRDVHMAIFLNPISRWGELGLKEKFKSRRQSAYNKRDQLKELGLIKFMNVFEIWEKNLRKGKLTPEEKEVLKKFNFWVKTMTEEQRRMYLSKTNYYAPTKKGLDKNLLILIKNSRKVIKQKTKF